MTGYFTKIEINWCAVISNYETFKLNTKYILSPQEDQFCGVVFGSFVTLIIGHLCAIIYPSLHLIHVHTMYIIFCTVLTCIFTLIQP